MRRRFMIVAVAVALAAWCAGAASAATTRWAIQATPNPTVNSALVAVSCASPASCMGAGQYLTSSGASRTLAERWNGRTWAIQVTPNPPGSSERILAGISCASATSCTAAGSYTSRSGHSRTLAERWNGRKWAIQSTLNPPGSAEAFLGGVSCAAVSRCTAVGDYTNSAGDVSTLAERWNGRTWAIQSTPNPRGSSDSFLAGISCSSAASCTAAGQYSDSSGDARTLAERWNGRTWAIQPTPEPAGPADNFFLNAVSCPSAASCTASGASYLSSSGSETTLAEHWNGSTWAIQSTPNPRGSSDSFLAGISCSSATSCTVAGQYSSQSGRELFTLAEHWNGRTWAIQSTPNPSGSSFSSLADISCSSATSCTAAGQYTSRSGHELTLAEHN